LDRYIDNLLVVKLGQIDIDWLAGSTGASNGPAVKFESPAGKEWFQLGLGLPQHSPGHEVEFSQLAPQATTGAQLLELSRDNSRRVGTADIPYDLAAAPAKSQFVIRPILPTLLGQKTLASKLAQVGVG
jgi:hypothetical protein